MKWESQETSIHKRTHTFEGTLDTITFICIIDLVTARAKMYREKTYGKKEENEKENKCVNASNIFNTVSIDVSRVRQRVFAVAFIRIVVKLVR